MTPLRTDFKINKKYIYTRCFKSRGDLLILIHIMHCTIKKFYHNTMRIKHKGDEKQESIKGHIAPDKFVDF